jgi:N-methylhydantoinase A
MGWLIGVDVGGTFTDLIAQDEATGRTVLHKVPSTPEDPAEAIVAGLGQLAERAGLAGPEIARFAHGTTVATNALIERKGGRMALVTTRGFRDLLEIGRQIRPRIYDLQADQAAPLIPRERRLEVAERVGADGAALAEPDAEAIDPVVEAIAADPEIEAVAVCFLFAFLNPAHERRVADALRARRPDIFLSLSSEVQPEFREYERLSTTVLNAFLQPRVTRYLERLGRAVAAEAPRARIGINQSSGGLMSIDRAAAMPVRTALSGPAAGVVGAAHIARLAGERDVITLDMGGTSTDVCLIRDGGAAMTHQRDVAGFPIRMPAIDIHTVGAGGGSVAWFAADGLLKVGPRSAGAVPGPACYGRGGTEATVSDANLVLGRLPELLVGGRMTLDRPAAEAALAPVAERLGGTAVEAARGVIDIAVSNMVRAIRAVSVERGHDPRDCALMAFGGAGALHAVDVARALRMPRVLIPPAPGILCAHGLIVADLAETFVTTRRTLLSEDLSVLVPVLEGLRAKAERWFGEEGVAEGERALALALDMRYVGQNYELAVEVPPPGAGTPALPDAETLAERFFEAHAREYGHHDPEAPVEIMTLRLTATGRLSPPDAPRAEAEHLDPERTAPVWFGDEAVETPIRPREGLAPGDTLEGPAILTQMDATTVVPPGTRLTVDGTGALILEVDA